MTMDFSNSADDFFVNLNLQTTLSLPGTRESILTFFEAVQKEFPLMTAFFQRETGEFVLEGDRESGSYQWVELQAHRLTAGYFNPPDIEDAYRLHRWLLDRSVYFLGVSGLDIERLDCVFGFNLNYQGNRDQVVAQALVGGTPLGAILSEPQSRSVEFEPTLVIALDEGCYMQARVTIETRSSSYQVRTGTFEDEPISVYFSVQRYPRPGKLMNAKDSFISQCEICEDLTERIVVPAIVQPIATAIASAG